ncbi:MAG: hypothetical protein Q9163_000382 [Psora crenata]
MPKDDKTTIETAKTVSQKGVTIPGTQTLAQLISSGSRSQQVREENRARLVGAGASEAEKKQLISSGTRSQQIRAENRAQLVGAGAASEVNKGKGKQGDKDGK